MRIALVLCLLLGSTTLAAQRADHWEVEAESTDTHLEFSDEMVELWTSAGLTLWWRQPMTVPFTVDYEAMVVKRDSSDRLSDLNCFWLATDPGVADGNVMTRLAERTASLPGPRRSSSIMSAMAGTGTPPPASAATMGARNRPCLPSSPTRPTCCSPTSGTEFASRLRACAHVIILMKSCSLNMPTRSPSCAVGSAFAPRGATAVCATFG